MVVQSARDGFPLGRSVGRGEEGARLAGALVPLAPLTRTPSMPDLPQEGGGTATAAKASATLVRLELRARLREQHGVVRSNDDE